MMGPIEPCFIDAVQMYNVIADGQRQIFHIGQHEGDHFLMLPICCRPGLIMKSSVVSVIQMTRILNI